MSGVQLAAAAIGVADVTIKVLQVGYTLVSDVRHYGTDAPKIGLKFQQLSHRYDSLQKVLLEDNKFPFLQGKKLFHVLPEHSQKLVVQLFSELLKVMYAHFALEQKYQSYENSSPGAAESGVERHLGLTVEEEKIVFRGTTSGQAIEGHKASSIFSWTGWSWAIRGKRRTIRLNAEFEGWLKGTKAVLEDTWWPLPAFSVLSNLDAVQSDSNATDAGLANSAWLRRLIIGKTDLPVSLNTAWASVTDVNVLRSGKKIGTFEGSRVLVEDIKFPLSEDGDRMAVYEERLSKIVLFLNHQNDPDFRALHCLKYSSEVSESSGKLRLISQLPASTPTVRTLASLYRATKSNLRPSLSLRLQICHHLAESIFLLHSVDWVHRAIRSNNILFLFPSDDLSSPALQHAAIRICGFEASRPAADTSLGPYDNLLSRNVSRHPERWGTPRKTFSRVHDVYALGVLLLEIGLWEKAEDMVTTLKPEEKLPDPVRKHLLRHVDERLAHRCGDVFAEAVRNCLTLTFDNTDGTAGADADMGDLERQQRVHRGLWEQVIDPLKSLKDLV